MVIKRSYIEGRQEGDTILAVGRRSNVGQSHDTLKGDMWPARCRGKANMSETKGKDGRYKEGRER